jgi:hypothetical protein
MPGAFLMSATPAWASVPLSEFQLAVLMFCLGGLVTLVTVVMILRGHRHWRHRDPFDRSA